MDNPAHQIASQHNEAQTKFDHLILGATLAICAYLAQTNPYGKLGWNIQTLLMVTLLIFAASAFAGFKRIEEMIAMLRVNVAILEEPNPAARRASLLQAREDKTAHRWYQARNYLLLLGLASYLGVKVWATYT